MLKSLGKIYTNVEMLRKLLQCLPTSNQGTKVKAIEEAQNLKALKLNDLVRALLTLKIHLQEEAGEHASQQGFTLKSNDIGIGPKESKSDDNKSLATITKEFKKMFQKRPEFKLIWKSHYQGGMNETRKISLSQKMILINTLVMAMDFQVT